MARFQSKQSLGGWAGILGHQLVSFMEARGPPASYCGDASVLSILVFSSSYLSELALHSIPGPQPWPDTHTGMPWSISFSRPRKSPVS